MCRFFSCNSDGYGKLYYFDAKARATLRLGNPRNLRPDSHASIAVLHSLNEDKTNKYEYNPLTAEFRVNQINVRDDRTRVEQACRAINFSTVVPELIIKPIIHPFKDLPPASVHDEHIALVRRWVSVWDSVRDSVGASVRDSVRDSVGDSVWDSVRDSVWTSVWTSVGAYISGFFRLEKWSYIEHEPGINPFQPAIDLWEQGLVPSFDGKTWRLHTGPDGRVVRELS